MSRLGRWIRRSRLRRAGATIARDLQSGGEFFAGYAPGLTCGPGAYIAEGARITIGSSGSTPGTLRIGSSLFLNHYAVIDCHGDMTIGDHVMIGPHAYIGDFDHVLPAAAGVPRPPRL